MSELRFAPFPHEAPGLEAIMRRASAAVEKELPPDVGFAVFVFHFGQGGYVAYGSNSAREDMVKMIGEWFLKQFEKVEKP